MKTQLAIDVNSVSEIVIAGKILSGTDIFKLFKEQDVFLYNGQRGNPPISLNGKEILCYDTTKLTKEEQEIFEELVKKCLIETHDKK